MRTPVLAQRGGGVSLARSMIRYLSIHASTALLFFAGIHAAENAAPVSAEHAARIKEGSALFVKTVRPALEESCLRCHKPLGSIGPSRRGRKCLPQGSEELVAGR